ncbi:MAG: sigma-54-dependent Fis family transcriptional regulator [Verrucomicrobia bacterium]|nr:sigma-54-dependent Fis family transcriptional regulator [Verrucomicrobiota bacterium]
MNSDSTANVVPFPPTKINRGTDPTMTDVGLQVRAKSIEKWGPNQAVDLVGVSSKMRDTLDKASKFAKFNQTILITGESGVGKELFAKACHVLSARIKAPFVVVNCPQYSEGNVTVSELFGHVKGSFTGAVADHKGLFDAADGGVVFLDEVGDLPGSAQTMLLRALAEKEVKPLGSNKTYSVDVRVIAATNRPLRDMIGTGHFRQDLYFRLRYFPLDIPALRERDEDWKLLISYFVDKLNQEYNLKKAFSPTSIKFLERYPWPGNVRELRSIVTIGFSMAESKYIEPDHFVSELRQPNLSGLDAGKSELFETMVEQGRSFWDIVHEPFLDRDLNRAQVREVISQGLLAARGSYRRMSVLFNIRPDHYQKFMDFLRHHRLKPEE